MNPLKLLLLLILCLAGPIAVFALAPPYAQPLWYHNFADQRCLLCIPHALNVVSNLPFVLVGGWGTVYLLSPKSRGGFYDASERWPYVVFFMALFAIILAERVGKVGRWLFVPLLALGAGSVLYWHITEVQGHGDLRLYFLVQFYPLLLLSFLLLLFPARYTRTSDLYGSLAWYAGAKLLELLDPQIYSQGQIVSGHTLKHLVAAVSAFLVLHMIKYRRPLPDAIPSLQVSSTS